MSVECTKQGESRRRLDVPRGGVVIKWEFAARETMPPGDGLLVRHGVQFPSGMTVEQLRQISAPGPRWGTCD